MNNSAVVATSYTKVDAGVTTYTVPANRIGGYLINNDNGSLDLYYIAATQAKSLTFANNGNVYAFQTTVDIAQYNGPAIVLGFDDGTKYALSDTPTDTYGILCHLENTTFIPQ